MKRVHCMLVLSAWLLTGCLGPIDLLGMDEAVSERKVRADDGEPPEIPRYDPERWVVEQFSGDCILEMNRSAAITKLDIVAFNGDDGDLGHRLFRGRREAMEALQKRENATRSLLPSMEVVNGVLKSFNDGLYASIEEGVQTGVVLADEEIFPSRQNFLSRLLAGLSQLLVETGETEKVHVDDAMAHIAAALILSDGNPDVSVDLMAEANDRVQQFVEAAIYSHPIGFYTWSETLKRVFMQDRFLQNYQEKGDPFSETALGKFVAMAVVLQNDAALLADYERILSLHARLTNPYGDVPVSALLDVVAGTEALTDIREVRDDLFERKDSEGLETDCGLKMALFPASKTKETMYFESQFCNGAPAGVNYIQLFIDAIRDGRVDLTPNAESGWYDYQSWALETLLLPDRSPEASHLRLTETYREKLLETFKSILIQNRETHVKQASMGSSISSAPAAYDFDVYPLFRAEPFPTFYLRNARTYRFLQTWLTTILGESFLTTRGRLTENGKMMTTHLLAELKERTALLYGLYFITADNVGMAPSLLDEELLEYSEAECREQADAWEENWLQDEDVAQDARVIVPVQLDFDRREVVYWATIGTRVVKAEAEFDANHLPEVRTCDHDLEDCRESYCFPGEFVAHYYYMLVDRSAEIRISMDTPPPTRDEFRNICDRYETAEDIISVLQSL